MKKRGEVFLPFFILFLLASANTYASQTLYSLIEKSQILDKRLTQLEQKLANIEKNLMGVSSIHWKEDRKRITLSDLKKGYELISKRKYKEAIRCFKKVLKENPRYAFFAYYNLGYIYAQFKDYLKAAKYFEESLRIKEDKDVYYNLAVIYLHYLNNPQRAQDYYLKYLSKK